MPKLTAPEISQLLREIGDRSALAGGNPYRAKAYRRAAENLALSTVPLGQLIAGERLKEIPGIGDGLAAVITKLYQTGEHPSLDTMRAETPPGVLEMLRIPGLKPDRIKKLHRDLGISSLAELEEAANSDRLLGVRSCLPGEGAAGHRDEPPPAGPPPQPCGGRFRLCASRT